MPLRVPSIPGVTLEQAGNVLVPGRFMSPSGLITATTQFDTTLPRGTSGSVVTPINIRVTLPASTSAADIVDALATKYDEWLDATNLRVYQEGETEEPELEDFLPEDLPVAELAPPLPVAELAPPDLPVAQAAPPLQEPLMGPELAPTPSLLDRIKNAVKDFFGLNQQ